MSITANVLKLQLLRYQELRFWATREFKKIRPDLTGPVFVNWVAKTETQAWVGIRLTTRTTGKDDYILYSTHLESFGIIFRAAKVVGEVVLEQKKDLWVTTTEIPTT